MITTWQTVLICCNEIFSLTGCCTGQVKFVLACAFLVNRFKPEPVQVLLSEEVTGSLRQLKGCYTLAKDRFKSLQQRGILEPRLPSRKKARKSWVEYEPGTKGQKEREMHEATLAERALRKQALAVLPLE
ncbi:hypothetical protein O6H91_Y072500 [Diphasiastrum complanatum]|nr:hypothetical protein O6H91_Y072500 [Diphasiastrum complanatum]